MVGTRSVLIVDDDSACRETYTSWLSDEYHVRVAADRDEARTRLNRATDVVLVSEQLVDSDFSVAAIRQQARDCHVVALTRLSNTPAVGHDEFDDALAKPTTRQEFEATVDWYLTRTAYERTLRSFYSLAATKADLEAELSRDRLAESTEYERICRRIAELRTQLTETVVDTDTDWAAIFEVCQASTERSEPQQQVV